MFNTVKTRLLVVMAALVLMPAVSAASMVSVSSTQGHEAWKLPGFLAPIASQSLSSASVPRISFIAAFALPKFVPSHAVPRNLLSGSLRRSPDISLWNLMAAVNAQKRGDSFELVEFQVAALPLSQPNGDPLSAVPLPPAIWLFVMGLLGLAGTRITGMKGSGSKAGNSAPARDRSLGFGGAVPA